VRWLLLSQILSKIIVGVGLVNPNSFTGPAALWIPPGFYIAEVSILRRAKEKEKKEKNKKSRSCRPAFL